MIQLYKEKITIDKSDIKEEAILTLIDLIPNKDATSLITFIYLTENRTDDNPLKDLQTDERQRLAKKCAFGKDTYNISKKFSKYKKEIADAVLEYRENQYNGTKAGNLQKDIDLYNKKMYQFMKLLKDTEPEIIKNTHEISGRVTFSTNIDILSVILDNIINIIMDKNTLVSMQKTGKFNGSLRGSLSNKKKTKLVNKINDE